MAMSSDDRKLLLNHIEESHVFYDEMRQCMDKFEKRIARIEKCLEISDEELSSTSKETSHEHQHAGGKETSPSTGLDKSFQSTAKDKKGGPSAPARPARPVPLKRSSTFHGSETTPEQQTLMIGSVVQVSEAAQAERGQEKPTGGEEPAAAAANTDAEAHTQSTTEASEGESCDQNQKILLLVANFDLAIRDDSTTMEDFARLAEDIAGRPKDTFQVTQLEFEMLVDDIRGAGSRLQEEVDKSQFSRVQGMLVMSDSNRLGVFHSEQSNSVYPVVKALRKISQDGVIVAVGQDQLSKDQPLALLSLGSDGLKARFEAQTDTGDLDGTNGLVISWYDRPRTVHAIAFAAFIFNRQLLRNGTYLTEDLFPREHQPATNEAIKATIDRLMPKKLTEKVNAILLEVLPDPIASNDSPHAVRKARDQVANKRSQARIAVQRDQLASQPWKIAFHLVYPHEKVIEDVVSQFKRTCLPNSAKNVNIFEHPYALGKFPRKERAEDWKDRQEGMVHDMVIIFVAADVYHEAREAHKKPKDVCKPFVDSGFQRCLIVALFDEYCLKKRASSGTSRSKSRRARLQSPQEQSATLVSLFGAPSMDVANQVKELTEGMLRESEAKLRQLISEACGPREPPPEQGGFLSKLKGISFPKGL